MNFLTHSAAAILLGLLSIAVLPRNGVGETLPRLSTVDGKLLYESLCAQCHGLGGNVEEKISNLLSPPPTKLNQLPYRYGSDLSSIIESVRQGKGVNMLHYDTRLSDEQIQAVSAYVYSLSHPRPALGPSPEPSPRKEQP